MMKFIGILELYSISTSESFRFLHRKCFENECLSKLWKKSNINLGHKKGRQANDEKLRTGITFEIPEADKRISTL